MTLTGRSNSSTAFSIDTKNYYSKLDAYSDEIEIRNDTAGILAHMSVGDASSGVQASVGVMGNGFAELSLQDYTLRPSLQVGDNQGNTSAVFSSYMQSKEFSNSSLEELKKNFEKLENGLDIVKATEIYKYNFKSQEDTDKKHIGFEIGDNYKYSKDITSSNNEGADTYSMVSVAYKAIQEQQELIEQLQEEIKKLKEEK